MRYCRYCLLPLLPLLAACGQQAEQAAQPEPPPAVCADLVQGCRAGKLGVRTETPPTAMQPFKLWVDAPGARAVTADLAMVDMDMGPNRYRMVAQEGRFVAAVVLPMCVSGRSDWLLTLEVDGKPVKLQFSIQGKPRLPH